MTARRLLFVASLGACIGHRGAAQARLSRPVIDTLPHGIVRVRNSGPSQWLGASGWKLVPEQTIAADGGSGLIAEPLNLAVDSHGDVFETDWKVDGIQEWDRTGKFIRTIGRKGDGPGEFKVPISITIRGDTLLAYASNQARVSLWHVDGRLIREWRVGFCCGGDPQFGAQGTVMVRFNGATRRCVIRWRPDGTVIDTILLPIEPPVRTWENAHHEYQIPFTPYQVGTFNSHASYVSGHGGRYSLVFARHGADSARVVEMPGARAPISTHVNDSIFAVYAKVPALSNTAKRADLPSMQPFFTALHADEHDNIWVERPSGDATINAFDVVDPDGRFLGTVAAPGGSIRHVIFQNERMYCIADTADGDVAIQVYRIDKGGT